MTDRIDDAWFDEVLAGVEVVAPPELRAEVRGLVRGVEVPAQGPPVDRRYRWWLAPLVAAAVVAVLVFPTVLGGRDDDQQTPPADTGGLTIETTTAPSAVAAEELAPATADATATSSAPAGERGRAQDVSDELAASIGNLLDALQLTRGVVLTGEDAADALASLDQHRLALLRRSAGFSGSVTFGRTWVLADGTKPAPDTPPTHVDVTVLASGDVWAEFDNGDWYRFDAATGIRRGVYTNAVTGALDAIQIQSAPHRHQYGSVFGHDPLARLDGLPTLFRGLETPTIEVQLDPGRAGVVQVRVATERVGEQQFELDLATGVIIGYQATQPDQTGTLGIYSAITDVAVADEFPVESPPALPPGVEWQILPGDTLGPTSLEDAVAAFGPGLVLPRVALERGSVTVEHSATTAGGMVVGPDDPSAVARNVTVEVVTAEGLLRSVFLISTSRTMGDGTVPEGYELRNGRLCWAPCDTTPVESEATDIAQAGALAGLGWYGEDGQLVRNQDGIHFAIEAPTPEQAIRLAESLVLVDEGGAPTNTAAARG